MSKKCMSDKDCRKDQLCTSSTGRCVNISGVAGKRELVQRSIPVTVPSFMVPKIMPGVNPLLAETKAYSPPSIKNGMVPNKKSGRFVKIDGKIGREIMKEYESIKTINVPVYGGKTHIVPEQDVQKFKGTAETSKCILDSKTPLRELQKNTVEYFNGRKALLVVHGTGMGKTLTALTAGQCYLSQNPKNRVVVLTAASLVDNFKSAYDKYGNVDSSKYQVINFDNFMNKYKKSEKKINKCDCENTLFIIDEVHTLKNYEGQKFSAAMECAKYSDKVLLLTATPYINSACDFISIIDLLHQKYVVGPSTRRKLVEDDPPIYQAKPKGEIPGCSTSLGKHSKDSVKRQLQIISTYLNGMVSFAEKPLGGDYPQFEIHTAVIPMNKMFELEFARSISGTTSLFSNPEKFYNGYRRAVNNIGANDFYNGKLAYIKDNILKPGVTGNVIFSNWLEFGVNVIEKFLKEQHITYAIITGETPIKDRKVFVELYNEGKINTLVISSAGGTGLDLRGTQNIIILDPVWNASQLDQIIGRGVRYMSHAHLPKEKQKVNIYLMTLVEQAFISGKQEFSRSGDYLLYKIIEKKREFGKLAEDMLKQISIL